MPAPAKTSSDTYQKIDWAEFHEDEEQGLAYYAPRVLTFGGLGAVAGVLGYGLYTMMSPKATKAQNAKAMGLRVVAQGAFLVGVAGWAFWEKSKPAPARKSPAAKPVAA